MAAAHSLRPSDYLKTYTVRELEIIADKQIKTIEDDFIVPVDIEKLVENIPGVDLDIYPKLRANHGLDGMVGTVEDDTIFVYLDDDLADSTHLLTRYRMTVAEELAHILLHREAIIRIRTVDDFKDLHNHHKWFEHERNAKRLAAAILMPASYVLEDSRLLYTKMVEVAGYSNPEAIKKMLKNKLAEKYNVSPISMGIRLSEWPIKIIEKIDKAMHDKLDFLD